MTMKKVVYLLGLILMMAGVAKAQDTKVKNGPEIEFEKVVHDYGTIPYNGNGECEFRFTNTGNEPLLIQKPKSSCGCTIPSWPNEPILPAPVNSFEFHRCRRTPQVGCLTLSLGR